MEPEIFTIPANWQELAKKLRVKYEFLTDADVKFEVGKENELLGCIASRLHLKREEVIKIINAA